MKTRRPFSQRSGNRFLIPLLLFFTFLSFYGLSRQSLLYHDAGVYLLETKFLEEGFRLARSLGREASGGPEFWEKIKSKTEGVPLHSGKPGFNSILWIASRAGGLDDSLSAKVTAALGILGLGLTFVIARKVGGLRSALYGTALLASSVFYLVYSRSGIAEQAVTVFFLLGIYCYLRSEERASPLPLYLAGFFLGYAFTCNPWRVLYLPALLVAWEVRRETFGPVRRLGMLARRIFILTLGFLTPLVLFEAPYLLLRVFVKPLPFLSYWEHLADKLSWITASGGMLWFQTFWDLGREFEMVEGPVFCGIILFSWIFLMIRFARKKSETDLFFWWISFVPFFYFSLSAPAGMTNPRVVSSVIPIACIGAGRMIAWIQDRVEAPRKVLLKFGGGVSLFIVILLLAQGLPRQLEYGLTRSGYGEASRYLQSTGEKKFMILGMEPIWRFYLGRVAFEPYHRPTTIQEFVEKSNSENIRYAAVDYTTIHSNYGTGFTGSWVDRVTPAAVFEHPLGSAPAYLLDQVGLQGARKILEDPRSRKIYLFRIKDIEKAFLPKRMKIDLQEESETGGKYLVRL